MIVKNMDELGEIESLYKEYYGSLCYYALNYVCDMEVAQDIVQDIFVHLIEARPKFETSLHGRNFLYLSVKNASLNYIDKKRSKLKYLHLHREEEIYYDRCNEALYLRQSGMRKQSQTLC